MIHVFTQADGDICIDFTASESDFPMVNSPVATICVPEAITTHEIDSHSLYLELELSTNLDSNYISVQTPQSDFTTLDDVQEH